VETNGGSADNKGGSTDAGARGEERIAVVVTAYNVAATLIPTLDRIPQSFRERVAAVVVCDDASSDRTFELATEYGETGDLPITIIRNAKNRGYGGNQKAGYRWAIDHDIDIVVMLHGDGQYAPEIIEDIVAPLEAGQCDAVFGSRMMVPGAARMGGMPLYKYVGNRILTEYENAVVGLDLTEWHSGYRAYRVSALEEIPFESNSEGFDFDTEIIVQLHEAGKTITEIPIPTYYGDEICYVNGMKYAKDVVLYSTRYRAHKMGFGSGELAFADQGYNRKLLSVSSHLKILDVIGERKAGEKPKKILDLGCSQGRFGEMLRLQGHTVIGVDAEKVDGVAERLDRFVEADLNEGLPAEVGRDFDVVVAADVFGHLAKPEQLLSELVGVLAPRGVIIATVPNIAHWYPRFRMATGTFDYDVRGVFDAGHMRFFTDKSFARMAQRAGTRVRRVSNSGLPLEVAKRGGPVPSKVLRTVGALDRLGLAVLPKLFSYQYVFELEPA
jgi:glycosyltransferase involved in cell wall biosynthesis